MYKLIIAPADVSILTAIMDIPELPDVIDSLVKTYQSKFLWHAQIIMQLRKNYDEFSCQSCWLHTKKNKRWITYNSDAVLQPAMSLLSTSKHTHTHTHTHCSMKNDLIKKFIHI